MFSIDCAVRAQSRKASRKRVQVVVLNTLAGKFARFGQFRQVSRKPSKLLDGEEARPVTEDRLMAGKVVSAVQFDQAKLAFITELRLIRGKDVRLEQFCQH